MSQPTKNPPGRNLTISFQKILDASLQRGQQDSLDSLVGLRPVYGVEGPEVLVVVEHGHQDDEVFLQPVLYVCCQPGLAHTQLLKSKVFPRKNFFSSKVEVVHSIVNPLVPRVQKIKISNLTLNRLLIVEFVKKTVYLGAHYSERQGLMG